MSWDPEKIFERVSETIGEVNPSAIVEASRNRDELTFTVDRRWLLPVLRALKTGEGLAFDMLSDVTAIDYLHADRLPRFDVVYHLYSLTHHHRVRLKVPLEEDDATLDSICGLWSGANFMEREVYDMFGITFTNHPNMKRILMPDDWDGHPLRKDFPLGGSKSFYYKHDTNEYAGEPDDLVPRIRVQEGDI